jgi:hypothetical protein
MAVVIEVKPPDTIQKKSPGKQAAPPGEWKIQCPKCHWKPGDADRWECVCQHSWNTFQTRGRCPACGKQWTETQCPHCGEWSPHEAWYVDETISFPA